MTSTTTSWSIVSGAAGAVGRCIALRYAARGRKVLALDQLAPRDEDRQAQSITECTIDLTDCIALRAALDELIPRSDAIGILVNATGLIWNEPLLSVRSGAFVVHDIANWGRVIDANLTASFIAATAVASRMARKGGGSIVNFSSIAAKGIAGQVAYSAAKAGVEGMTKAMAQELAPLGVRVNAIAPGFIDLPSTRASLSPEKLDEYIRRTPLGRLGTIDDLVSAIEMLEHNAFANGTIVDLDGGLRI